MNIGKYKVTGLLGRGGMGRVYKARLPEIGKTVAIKLYCPHTHMIRLLGEKTARDMFLAEARILGNICHPQVAQLFDFDHDLQGRPFFVMEYHCMNLGEMTGEDYIMENPVRMMPPDRVARYLGQVLSGLGRLHDAGIIHRDVKPFNMLVSEFGQVKIIDFGLSLLRGETRGVPEQFKIGTPYYAAPEQEADPDTVDERADIYGAGVMAWRMLTGHFPPERGTRPLPGKLNPMLGDCWNDLLLCATSPDPLNRFSDCSQMAAALDTALSSWQQSLEQTCRMQELPVRHSSGPSKNFGPARKAPVKAGRAEARRVFGLDELWRPVFPGRGEFEPRDQDTVRDVFHKLIWQRAGSRWPMEWNNAGEYIDSLNAGSFAGISTWRLPTLDELTLLLFPVSVLGDFCTPAVFNPGMDRLWSADRRSFTSAWYADTSMGYAGSADFTCRIYVRAVS